MKHHLSFNTNWGAGDGCSRDEGRRGEGYRDISEQDHGTINGDWGG